MDTENLERTLIGKLKVKLPIYEKDNFRKIEFVVTTNEQYPQIIKFEVNQTRCFLLVKVKTTRRNLLYGSRSASFFSSLCGVQIFPLFS